MPKCDYLSANGPKIEHLEHLDYNYSAPIYHEHMGQWSLVHPNDRKMQYNPKYFLVDLQVGVVP